MGQLRRREGTKSPGQQGRAEPPRGPRRIGSIAPSLPVPSEQVLHLWLEVLCSSLPTVEKWYQPWSFLRSPGWVQIKCELRVLCCFAFSLSQDWELPAKREEEKKPLKEGVQDMLVKHHLFSWDIDG